MPTFADVQGGTTTQKVLVISLLVFYHHKGITVENSDAAWWWGVWTSHGHVRLKVATGAGVTAFMIRKDCLAKESYKLCYTGVKYTSEHHQRKYAALGMEVKVG
jgi:hypothetical protein